MDGKGQNVFGKDISINDQHLEEAEELEDRRRREEEVSFVITQSLPSSLKYVFRFIISYHMQWMNSVMLIKVL